MNKTTITTKDRRCVITQSGAKYTCKFYNRADQKRASKIAKFTERWQAQGWALDRLKHVSTNVH